MAQHEKRYNIGLLIANITDAFSNGIAKGAIRRAAELDANLVIFPGKYIGIQNKYEQYDIKYEYQYNVLFDIAAAAELDYLITAVGTIAYAYDGDQRKAFLDSLGNTPVLSVASEIEGYDFLQYDNRAGVSETVDFLIEHGYKNIGYMVGNLNNSECAERFEAYKESLERNGIRYREQYITECDLAHESIYDARPFLERNPELDAILCINDIVASKVYEALAEKGIKVGEDIAVIGFDDQPFCRALSPEMSSIRADAEMLGAVSVEKAVNFLNKIPDDRHYVKTSFVQRASCPTDDMPQTGDKGHKKYAVEKYEERTHLENIFIRDTMMFGGDTEKSYSEILKQLSCIGADTGYIYVYEKPIRHRVEDTFPRNLPLLFKSYCYGKTLFSVPENEQKLTVPEAFDNIHLPNDRRRTFIAVDLYSAENQYGIALVEPGNESFFDEVELVTYQLSSAVRTIDALKNQNILLAELDRKNRNLVSENERIAAELGVAAKIQSDMLPSVFPAFPGRTDFDIYATMTPAKEIGGDFYDFFLIDDDRIALVMADVSGKGVPAALFMVIAKTLIHDRAMGGGTPAEVLSNVNTRLCENNASSLFVTVWLAIIDLSTGLMTYSNAGHEYPVFRRAGSEYEIAVSDNCPPLAAAENIDYYDEQMKLESGDRVLLYTDGVPEAKSAKGTRFGTDLMLKILNSNNSLPASDTIKLLRAHVDEFTGDASPFDDVTILCFDYFGNEQ